MIGIILWLFCVTAYTCLELCIFITKAIAYFIEAVYNLTLKIIHSIKKRIKN